MRSVPHEKTEKTEKGTKKYRGLWEHIHKSPDTAQMWRKKFWRRSHPAQIRTRSMCILHREKMEATQTKKPRRQVVKKPLFLPHNT